MLVLEGGKMKTDKLQVCPYLHPECGTKKRDTEVCDFLSEDTSQNGKKYWFCPLSPTKVGYSNLLEDYKKW